MPFKVARWTVVGFTAMTALAMAVYPGGTLRNPSTREYVFFHNFLSDLGTTVTWGGHSNTVASTLFVLAVILLMVALTPCFAAFVRLYSSSRSRKWTRAAAVCAVLGAVGFLAAAVTPTDRLFGIHIRGVQLAFYSTLLTTLFFSFATARDSRFPRQVPVVWFFLTLLLSGYVVMLTWGPGVHTDRGLITQVAAQKITVAGALLIVCYQSYAAEQVAARVGLAKHPRSQ